MSESNTYENAMAEYENTLASFRAKFDEIKNFNKEQTKGATAFQFIADPLGAHLLTTYGGDAVQNIKNYLGEKTQGIRDTITNKAEDIKTRLGQAVEDKVDEIKQNILDRVNQTKSEIQTRAQGLQDEVQNRLAGAQDEVQNTIADLKSGFDAQGDAADQLSGIPSKFLGGRTGDIELPDMVGGQNLPEAGIDITGIKQALSDATIGRAKGLVDEATNRVANLAGEVQGRAMGLAQDAAQGVSNLGNEATTALSAARTEATGFFQDLGGQVMNLGRTVFNDVKGQLTSRVGAISDEVSSRAAGAGDLLTSLPNQVAAEAGARLSNLPSIPNEMVQRINARMDLPVQYGPMTEEEDFVAGLDAIARLPDSAAALAGQGQTPLQAARQMGETILPDVRQAVSEIPEINLSTAATNAATTATDAATTATDVATTAVSTGAKAIAGLAKGGEIAAETVARTAGSEATEAIVTGVGSALAETTAETGVGAIIGGLLAVGGLLAGLFGHHNAKPPPPPNTSAPQFQAGLAPQ